MSQMRSNGDSITDETVVAKVLRSLTPKFDHVVAAIEESKDLSIFSFDELMGSLQAHEVRINRTFAKDEEKAFQSKGEPESSFQRYRGRGRGGFRGRGRGRTNSLHCSFCNKYGYTEKFCWSKPDEANYAEEEEEQDAFFGCSHHITGDKSKFSSLDKSVRSHVRLGDDKQLQIEGQEGIATVVYLLNISPTKAVWNQTPYEARCGNKPSAYRFYDLTCEKIIVSRNVVFDEPSSWKWEENAQSSRSDFKIDVEEVTTEAATQNTPENSSIGSTNTTPTNSNAPLILFAGDPLSVEEALQKNEWRSAMEDELHAINKNLTWELVDLPQGRNAIGLKWIFKTKFLTDGTLAAQKQWKVVQFDVKSAFLNGDLQEEVYVSQPPGFENCDDLFKVFRLKKALYGLKQAPLAWYSKIDEFFHKNRFERSIHEPTLYLKKQGMNDFMIVSLYVDDMIYTGSSIHLVSEFKRSMMNMLDMTDLGELHYFLGLEVVQTNGGIFMSQKKYVEDTLQKFNMVGCKIAVTPMNISEKLEAEDGT
ncbi:retrovirus-related pol polyprotein from transposon TNT 1-94 [Tanacetum coccineum]